MIPAADGNPFGRAPAADETLHSNCTGSDPHRRLYTVRLAARGRTDAPAQRSAGRPRQAPSPRRLRCGELGGRARCRAAYFVQFLPPEKHAKQKMMTTITASTRSTWREQILKRAGGSVDRSVRAQGRERQSPRGASRTSSFILMFCHSILFLSARPLFWNWSACVSNEGEASNRGEGQQTQTGSRERALPWDGADGPQSGLRRWRRAAGQVLAQQLGYNSRPSLPAVPSYYLASHHEACSRQHGQLHGEALTWKRRLSALSTSVSSFSPRSSTLSMFFIMTSLTSAT